jgi:hypothetical protein
MWMKFNIDLLLQARLEIHHHPFPFLETFHPWGFMPVLAS